MMCYKPKETERRIMEDDASIESLIASTITHIKTALDSDKPREAKVYTEILWLLRETLSRSLETRKRMELFDKTYSKPFEKISEKHNPNV